MPVSVLESGIACAKEMVGTGGFRFSGTEGGRGGGQGGIWGTGMDCVVGL